MIIAPMNQSHQPLPGEIVASRIFVAQVEPERGSPVHKHLPLGIVAAPMAERFLRSLLYGPSLIKVG